MKIHTYWYALFAWFLFVSSVNIVLAQAKVPPSEQFQYVNEGEFDTEDPAEYGADTRCLPFARPFALCFYNVTPNEFTLAIRMGTHDVDFILRRWVWEANVGNPVKDNATLTFRQDGNLVLAHVDGRVAWQTGTANKGVVGFRILDNGNMVLYDSKGKYVWQSFDSPRNTLLVGQSLRPKTGPYKLVSRSLSSPDGNGPYTLILEPKRLVLQYTAPNLDKPVVYYVIENTFEPYATLFAKPAEGTSTQLGLVTPGTNPIEYDFDRPKYNATLSFLRLESNGNLVVYTYYDQVTYEAEDVTYALFNRELNNNECLLPERCGEFGLCQDSQCVACPSDKGLLGWSSKCKYEKPKSCDPKTFHYYKLEGVDHFMTKYTSGSVVKVEECGRRCTRDCKCLGYFYNKESSKCWIAYDLKTLASVLVYDSETPERVPDLTRVAYIKTPNV
ncbi:PREDICTED: epidermis-specific secreted glycoprotein EP1-like [Tarenaya hassleriana]|uniref:epidermis-specific secreted glycoprotein EP1-like n=1 Tax=Tarenaya hassleriana TaxID=28532 RepID=UPI00053C97EC|nr:PREDICTED: epidermis-specific secreted glycoprotein EP1-like [Tarenaya hassleriana]